MKLATIPTLMSLLAPAALAQELCGQYDYHSAAGYEFNNNLWGQDAGSGSQCLIVDRAESGGISWRAEWQWSGSENSVKSYPYGGRQLSPRIVSQIGSLPSSASWSYSGENIRANVAYDLFTHTNPDNSNSFGEYELMIWLGTYGDVWPIGDSTGMVNVAGQQWDLFDGWNGDMRVFSFIAPSPVNSFSADLMDFFDHLTQNNGFPADSQYLITNQFGTEPFTGGPATFTVDNWSAEVN